MTLAALLLLVAAARAGVIGADDQGTIRVAGDTRPERVPGRRPLARHARSRTWPAAGSGWPVARDDIAALIDRYPRRPLRRHRLRVASVAGLAAVGGHLEPAAGDVRHDAVRVDTPTRRPDQRRRCGQRAALPADRRVTAVPAGQNLVFYLGAGAPEVEAAASANSTSPRARSTAARCSVTGPPGAARSRDGRRTIGGRRAALRAVADQIGVPYVARDAAHHRPPSARGPGRRTSGRRRCASARADRVVLVAGDRRRDPRPDRALPGAARVPAHQAGQRGRDRMSS